MEALIVVAAVFGVTFVVLALGAAGVYNGLRRRQVETEAAWSDIDVQLKRRYDLVPNLVNTVKGYATHERETLEAVIAARSRAVQTEGSPAEQAKAEGELGRALGRLLMIGESYPALKADANFARLQEELVTTENRIGFARQHYNRCAANYNTAVSTFPGLFVAGPAGMRQREYFEMDDETHRVAPEVSFG